MVAQTSMNGNPHTQGAADGTAVNARAVAHDLWTLGELQCRLLAADFQESRRRVAMACAALAIGLAILLAGLPVALIALAKLLVAQTGLSEPAAYGCAALAAVLVAAGALLFGWRRLNGSLAAFSRSRDELRRNLGTIQSLIGAGHERARV